MALSRIANTLIILIATVIILVYGKSLMIPFILALLVWFLTKEARSALRKIPLVASKFPVWLQSLLAGGLIFSILGGIVRIVTRNIQTLSKSWQTYEGNIEQMITQVTDRFDLDLESILNDFLGNFEFSPFFRDMLSSLTDVFGNAFIIVLYALFLTLEETGFSKKLKAMYPAKDTYDEIIEIIEKIDQSIGAYLSIKSLVSLLTGFLSFIALWAIGIEAPVFWAFLIFLLNYIPTIGSLIATAFPALFALLQFGEFTPCLLVLVIVGAIQIIVGNIIEPRLMGDSLNISALVVLLALSFWGALWGVAGMLMSVPITVIIIIVFAEFPSTRPVAILLSDSGNVGQEEALPAEQEIIPTPDPEVAEEDPQPESPDT
ncbi:MAG: AI-2E family transporter [Bacteroidota bacterium]